MLPELCSFFDLVAVSVTNWHVVLCFYGTRVDTNGFTEFVMLVVPGRVPLAMPCGIAIKLVLVACHRGIAEMHVPT